MVMKKRIKESEELVQLLPLIGEEVWHENISFNCCIALLQFAIFRRKVGIRDRSFFYEATCLSLLAKFWRKSLVTVIVDDNSYICCRYLFFAKRQTLTFLPFLVAKISTTIWTSNVLQLKYQEGGEKWKKERPPF